MLEEHRIHKKMLMDKHMGCMAGFFHIFDRHHLLAAAALPPPPGNASSPSPSPSELSDASPPSSAKLPEPRPTLPLPLFDFQEGPRAPWKLKDSPRLSLDSRALEARAKPRPSEVHASGSGGGSPSVVARLMGLDALPKLKDGAELRRSASESGASREHLSCTFVRDLVKDVHEEKPMEVAVAAKLRAPVAPKSSFDARDFFPDKTAQRVSLYGEIERKLRTRGIDEPAKDLEALKQILEALRLKGLLHSHQGGRVGRRNLIVEEHRDASRCRSYASPPPPPPPQRNPPPRRERADGSTRTRKVRPTPDLAEARSPSTAASRRGALQKPSPVKSPRSAGVGPRRSRADSSQWTPSPRARRTTATATADLEKLRKMGEECSRGRSLLQRCDELLHSIAAITERGEAVEPPQQQQPSPVSVFDSSSAFCSDDAASAAASPSSVDSKGRAEESVDRRLTPSTSPAKLLQPLDEVEAADRDFAYVSDALGSGLLGFPVQDVKLALPRKEGEESSNARSLHRRLVLDTVAEILERTKQITPWEAFRQSRSSSDSASSSRRVWEEVKRLREHVPADSHADAVSGAIRKDMAAKAGGTRSWRERTEEMSGAVLDIERLIFKDLVRDTIRDLSSAGKCSAPRRRLVF